MNKEPKLRELTNIGFLYTYVRISITTILKGIILEEFLHALFVLIFL